MYFFKTTRIVVTALLVGVIGASLSAGALLGGSGTTKPLNGYPELDRGADLDGPDENQDGVRDDIAAWVTTRFTDPAHQAAALRAARAMQKVFSVDLADRVAVKQLNKQIAHADSCLYQTFVEGNSAMHAAEVSTRLEAMATNTRARLTHYLKFNQALDGAVWSTDYEDC